MPRRKMDIANFHDPVYADLVVKRNEYGEIRIYGGCYHPNRVRPINRLLSRSKRSLDPSYIFNMTAYDVPADRYSILYIDDNGKVIHETR